MRIAFVTGKASIGGSEIAALEILAQLQKLGNHGKLFFYGGSGSLSHKIANKKVPFFFAEGGSGFSSIIKLRKLISFLISLRTFSPEITVFFSPHSIAIIAPIVHFLTPHRNFAYFLGGNSYSDISRYPKLSKSLLAFSFQLNKGPILVLSQEMKSDLMSQFGLDTSRVRIITLGTNIPPKLANVSSKSVQVVSVGSARRIRGYETLVYAANEIDDSINFVICADEGESKPRIQELITDLGLEKRVAFVEPPADVAATLQVSQIAVHCSRSEGFSLAVLEEIANGLPIVAADIPPMHRFVKDGVNGFLFPVDDHQALVKSLRTLTENSDLRVRMQLESRKIAESYSWENSANAFYSAICT